MRIIWSLLEGGSYGNTRAVRRTTATVGFPVLASCFSSATVCFTVVCFRVGGLSFDATVHLCRADFYSEKGLAINASMS